MRAKPSQNEPDQDRTYSFSHLAQYERCPYQYFHIGRNPSTPPADQAVHHALALRALKVARDRHIWVTNDPKTIPPDTLDEMIQISLDGSALSEDDLAQVTRMVQIGSTLDIAPGALTLRKQFNRDAGGQRFQGGIDLFNNRKKGCPLILDYKTEQNVFNEDMEEKFRFWLTEHHHGSSHAEVQSYYLRHEYLTDPVMVSYSEAKKAEEWAVDLADDIEMRLQFGEVAFQPNPGDHCAHCSLSGECPDASPLDKNVSLDSEFVQKIADKHGISSLAAYVLASRSYDDFNAGTIVGKGAFTDPFALPHMTEAVNAVRSASYVVVAGDYDADGICGSLIVSRTLDRLGIPNDICLPDRSDGYGLSVKALEMAKEKNADMVIAVDCGTNDVDVADQIVVAGIDLIVLDHHPQSGPSLAAGIIVNPAVAGPGELCGAGVAYKFAQALGVDDEYLLVLAGLATIGDSVPLRGENRLIAREGLKALRRTTHPGLVNLFAVAKLSQDLISSRDVAFSIVPRLNAPGRITTPYDALRLLQAAADSEAAELAARLNNINERRKTLLNEAVAKCDEMIRGLGDHAALVLWGDIHLGVCGIAAARLTEKYGKPAFVGYVMPDGTVKGSGRSVEGYNVADALASCAEYLTGHGGHAAAAGFSAMEADIPALRIALDRHARDHCRPPEARDVRPDVKVRADQVTLDQVRSLDCLEPFGQDFPEPVFHVEGICRSARMTGVNQQHLILGLGELEAAYFNGRFGPVSAYHNQMVNVVGSLHVNRFRGEDRASMRVRKVFVA